MTALMVRSIATPLRETLPVRSWYGELHLEHPFSRITTELTGDRDHNAARSSTRNRRTIERTVRHRQLPEINRSFRGDPNSRSRYFSRYTVREDSREILGPVP